ncbi:hypothetical protein O7606_09870 [Micromonospora sp. WMMD882]|uniref:hypothetical protein n=1 Tax=Micromonospora sp. WMMD882 TaxID=3015151 RepID=UPI00248C0B9D|nr:hypothetical protein [Micromonospora sp. WMMD882]WBB81638.1 hypothetical protein O7606_09870 [Micromonospora sp. WMMD882]
MLPVAFDRPRWWSARRAFRLLTGLAVAVALALSGGLATGGPSGWSGAAPAPTRQALRLEPAPPTGPTVGPTRGWSAPPGNVPVPAVPAAGVPGATAARGAAPVAGFRWSGATDRDERAARRSAGPTGGGSGAPAATEHAPVRPLVGGTPGVAGPRAPPPG